MFDKDKDENSAGVTRLPILLGLYTDEEFKTKIKEKKGKKANEPDGTNRDVLGKDDDSRIVKWNELRKAINKQLLTYKVNEDKLMGPYFIPKKNLPESETIDPAVFTRIFKSKVIMYLFDDAAKQKRLELFGGCAENARNQYSKICEEFEKKGVYIFCDAISSQFDNCPRPENVGK